MRFKSALSLAFKSVKETILIEKILRNRPKSHNDHGAPALLMRLNQVSSKTSWVQFKTRDRFTITYKFNY